MTGDEQKKALGRKGEAIAAKYYGNGADYNKIFNANTDKISNPNLIYVGQVLTIP